MYTIVEKHQLVEILLLVLAASVVVVVLLGRVGQWTVHSRPPLAVVDPPAKAAPDDQIFETDFRTRPACTSWSRNGSNPVSRSILHGNDRKSRRILGRVRLRIGPSEPGVVVDVVETIFRWETYSPSSYHCLFLLLRC